MGSSKETDIGNVIGSKIFKTTTISAGSGAQHQHSLVQNQIVERVVFKNWFSYCSKRHYNSYLVALSIIQQEMSAKLVVSILHLITDVFMTADALCCAI